MNNATATKFEYDEGLMIDTVNDLMCNLHCDLTHLDKLVKVYEEEGSINGADLEEPHPEASECYENIMDYIYGYLLDHDVICEDFGDKFGREADDLLDYMVEQVELALEEQLELAK